MGGGGGGIGSIFSNIVKVATLGLVDIEGQQKAQKAADAQAAAARQQAEAAQKQAEAAKRSAEQQAKIAEQQRQAAEQQLLEQQKQNRQLESEASAQDSEAAAVRDSERGALINRRGLSGTMLTSSLGTTGQVTTTGAKLGSGSLS